MHVPDGFLDAKTVLATAGLALAGVGLASRQARLSLPPQRRPLMGLAAAFVFAAQMLNFPVAGGTSGHLLGSVLAAVLLGPSAAVVVMTAVLMVQCFLFNDGGILTLGANVFNMAIVASLGGYGIYRIVRSLLPGSRGMVAAAAFAAWCSTMLAAISCAGELACAKTVSWLAVFPAMVNVHMLIGLGEGLLTSLILVAIVRVRPDLIDNGWTQRPSPKIGGLVGYGLILSVGLALFVAPFASPWPDGLERVAAALGFVKNQTAPLLNAPIADYQLPGLKSAVWATAWAGAIGTLITFILAWLLARVLVPRNSPANPYHGWPANSAEGPG